MKQRITAGKKLEWISIAVFALGLIVIGSFHEPWFDEAQSWQIAKCESIGRLLFYIPRYEGNPPLWYLILAIPAKLGVPFEIGLKSVGLIISLGSVLLLEFKSPFPRAVKLILPFTYFFFYQYGIIVRPYGMMILAFILVAMAFKARNTKPWRFVLCLAFLCETSSFCVAVAGGIAACWLFEILKEGFLPQKWIRDKRIYSLFALFVFAIILVLTILPPEDASFTSFLEGENSVLKCFFVALTTALSETLIYTSPWFSYETMTLAAAHISTGALIAGIVLQTIIVLHICCFSSKRNLNYFLIPYLCYCIFGAFVVLAGHYLGVGYCVFIFWLWVNCADDEQFEIGRRIAAKLHISDKDKSKLKMLGSGLCVLSVVISFAWTALSSWKEITYQYSYGRETARFLEETGLVNARIAVSWFEESSESGEPDYEEMDTKSNGWPVPLCAYAGRNIVYNFNDGADDAAYVQFIRQTGEQNKDTIERWSKQGIPEVLLGNVDVELLTDGAVTAKDYTPVYRMQYNYIWKGHIYSGKQYVYVRNDLLGRYGVEPLVRPEGIVGGNGFAVTDKMRERYENGEDIEDIIKPALDYLFGEESGK